jgi:hypothetical protein
MGSSNARSLGPELLHAFRSTLVRAASAACVFSSVASFVLFAAFVRATNDMLSAYASVAGTLCALLLVWRRYVPSPLFARDESRALTRQLLRHEPELQQLLQQTRSRTTLAVAGVLLILAGPLAYTITSAAVAPGRDTLSPDRAAMAGMIYVAPLAFIVSVGWLVAVEWMTAAVRIGDKRLLE